jgi:hypothetical protein
MILPLTNDEKSRLQRLNQQKEVVFALKKLFLNACIDEPVTGGVQELAAERLAQAIIRKTFHDLEVIQPDSPAGTNIGNLV